MALMDQEQLAREVKESSQKGNLCSQIVMEVGLRHLGMEKPEVVKAMGGLVGAQGLMGATCGCLTAAACLIASAATGKLEQGRMYMLIQELEERFQQELVAKYPGNHCDDILEAYPGKIPTEICPPIIAGSIRIALELLEAEGLEVS
ncbi:MAG: C-GCAxxG-C-C family (seleno)protein [Thermodesulfobacteriota bacterium]